MSTGYRCAMVAMGMLLFSWSVPEANAYYPAECFPAHAKDDFRQSSLVVIGRVTGIERYRVSLRKPSGKDGNEPVAFFYLATVTVGRTLKGKVSSGDEILLFTGSYQQRKEDNVASTHLQVAQSHPPWTLEYDHVYLLALDADEAWGDKAEVRRDRRWVPAALQNRQIWRPRSCHWSVHEVITIKRRDPVEAGPHGMGTVRLLPEVYVMPYFDRWR